MVTPGFGVDLAPGGGVGPDTRLQVSLERHDVTICPHLLRDLKWLSKDMEKIACTPNDAVQSRCTLSPI
jgi:hypothetical protein